MQMVNRGFEEGRKVSKANPKCRSLTRASISRKDNLWWCRKHWRQSWKCSRDERSTWGDSCAKPKASEPHVGSESHNELGLHTEHSSGSQAELRLSPAQNHSKPQRWETKSSAPAWACGDAASQPWAAGGSERAQVYISEQKYGQRPSGMNHLHLGLK